MEAFQVIEEQEGIEREILRRLAACGWKCGAAPRRPALLVVSPKAAAGGAAGVCRTALLPGDVAAPSWDVQAASAVSYGVGPRNTITISSQEGDVLWMALQRELVTIQGQVVDRQEFLWKAGAGRPALSELAVAGALLLLGMPPEQLAPAELGKKTGGNLP